MSQFFVDTSSAGPVPPFVATSYVTQNGTAVPAANILLVNGFDSIENNANGIITKGGVAGTGVANEVDVVITNRTAGDTTTNGAVTSAIITFTMPAVASVVNFECKIAAFNSTSTLGAVYLIIAGARTDGATTSSLNTADITTIEEGAMSGASVSFAVAGNTAIFNVTGYLAQNIRWSAVLTYNQVI